MSIETPLGPVRFKIASRDGRVLNAAAEFDDCARIAAERGLPIKDVQAHRHASLARLADELLVTGCWRLDCGYGSERCGERAEPSRMERDSRIGDARERCRDQGLETLS